MRRCGKRALRSSCWRPGTCGCVQGDAGEDGPQRRARHRATDAARLVSAGALQVACARRRLRAVLTARKLVQSKLHDIEMSLRGILRGFGLKVGKTTDRSFAGRIEELVAGHPNLEAIARGAAGGARGAAAASSMASRSACGRWRASHAQARLLMTTPAVGPIVALTYAGAIDDPARFRSSKRPGPHFGLTPKKYQSGETDYHRADLQDRRRRGAGGALSGRQRHADQAGEGLLGNSRAGRCASPGAPACARPRWRSRASLP